MTTEEHQRLKDQVVEAAMRDTNFKLAARSRQSLFGPPRLPLPLIHPGSSCAATLPVLRRSGEAMDWTT